MNTTNSELAKSLVSLIDETLEEIEELKKSKFNASEIKIEGPGEGISGKPTNGDLDAKKADKEEDEDDKKDKDDVEKGVLDEAEKSKDAKVEKKEDKDDDKKEEKEEEKEEKEVEVEIKKSNTEVTEELMKSYIDSKISPLEDKLSNIIDVVNKIADQPAARKSVPAGSIVPLKKSEDAVEPLSKSDIANKLMDLKKNGTTVDSLDMVKVELGNESEAMAIANKYGLK